MLRTEYQHGGNDVRQGGDGVLARNEVYNAAPIGEKEGGSDGSVKTRGTNNKRGTLRTQNTDRCSVFVTYVNLKERVFFRTGLPLRCGSTVAMREDHGKDGVPR